MQNTINNDFTILWTELDAFSPDAADCGAAEYVARTGFVPDAVSLFLFGCDFVHLHNGMEADEDFPPDIGNYLDMYFEGPKHPGKVWSKFKLRTLVRELQSHGIKVLFSVFPATLNSRFHREWVADHPEVQNRLVGELKRDPAAINPLKRFADGTFYEDFLVRKVLEVIADYNFDGWHLCDGYNHPWYQLWQSDFSDDMLEQSGISLPDPGMDFDARAEYIWQNRREEWVKFYIRRNSEHQRKLTSALHAAGKMITCHTCWVRDPVDAMYRYGVDYRILDTLGYDAIIVESCGASSMSDHIFRTHYPVSFENVVKTTGLLTRACITRTPLLYHTCTQDMTEGWSSLRHLTMFLEREIFEYSNLGIFGKGGLDRAFAGRQVCLADCMTASEWAWVKERWDLALSARPVDHSGAVLIWSNSACDTELKYFMHRHFAPSAAIIYKLMARGADISTVVNINDLAAVSGKTVIAVNPGLWSSEELQKLAAHTGKVIRVGMEELPDDISAGGFSATPEPLNFAVEHTYTDLTDAEYESVLAAMPQAPFRVYHAEQNPDAPHYRFSGYELEDGTWRILACNVYWRYIYGEIISCREMQSIVPVNNFRGRPFWMEKRDGEPGDLIYLRVPPLGTAVMDVVYKS